MESKTKAAQDTEEVDIIAVHENLSHLQSSCQIQNPKGKRKDNENRMKTLILRSDNPWDWRRIFLQTSRLRKVVFKLGTRCRRKKSKTVFFK